ncbi:MAG: hypothetical protein V1755_15070 [Chloroflexota bacterium]
MERAHLALAIVCLLIAAATVRDYGQSWDEPGYYRYGAYAVNAYRYFFHPHLLPPFDAFLELYGPVYFMAATIVASSVRAVNAAWESAVVWHFCYFLTFLLTILLTYSFSRRWLTPMASLGTCLLFASQPLLWGHAFINPKDIPFMAFFLASVHLGFRMVDRVLLPRRNIAAIALAAIVLGITVSIRPAGPLAGLIVAVYALSKSGRRSVPLLASYLLMALIVTYLTWPFLWAAPVERYWQSLMQMSNFPFLTRVQFMGVYYPGDELPWFYLPVILGIQLTEPTVLLVVGGLVLAIWRSMRRADGGTSRARTLVVLFAGWSLLPTLLILSRGSTIYDNARQLYFLLPPVFLLAGLAIELLERLIRPQILLVGTLFLLALPGAWASHRLHPYEYVYYNAFVGGTGGAYGRYEMDYWATSYSAVTAWLNTHAAANSKIWAMGGPADLLALNLRPDIELACTSDMDCGGDYEYVVALARWKAERRCRGAETVFSVGRQGAVFSVVKQLAAGKTCK